MVYWVGEVGFGKWEILCGQVFLIHPVHKPPTTQLFSGHPQNFLQILVELGARYSFDPSLALAPSKYSDFSLLQSATRQNPTKFSDNPPITFFHTGPRPPKNDPNY